MFSSKVSSNGPVSKVVQGHGIVKMYPELDTLREEKHFAGSAGSLDYEINQ